MLKEINIINSTGTDIGKTHLMLKLIKQEILKGNKIFAIKPIISGFNKNELAKSDIGLLLKALGMEPNMQNASKICHTFLMQPLSPNIAAQIEGIKPDYADILNFCLKKIESAGESGAKILIETAGGIMTPITKDKLMLDLTEDIASNFSKNCVNQILVTSNYLGTISHTLTACKVMDFDSIIFNIKQKTEHDDQIKRTIEGFLERTLI